MKETSWKYRRRTMFFVLAFSFAVISSYGYHWFLCVRGYMGR